MIKNILDFSFALLLTIFLSPVIVIVALLVRCTSEGPVIYWSERVGLNNKIFSMPKFRTMKIGTPSVATHLLDNPASVLTPVGGFLRRTSLDELPQLWSIFSGKMSMVGPRPALFNQDDLIALRTEKGIQKLRPGLTGWAQINGRDELSIPDKVLLDTEYLDKKSFLFDLKIIGLTGLKAVRRDNVSH